MIQFFSRFPNNFPLGLAICSVLFSFAGQAGEPTHGISTYGDLKYSEGFTHFDYVNPNAPKGGEATLATIGGFDSFNPYIIKGMAAPGAQLLHCSLMHQSEDEPSSLYAYLAEKIEVAPDRTSVTFTLNPKAKFTDGTPITADDVLYSFDILHKEGAPLFGLYFKDVVESKKLGTHKVQFKFIDGTNRELPIILGQLPVFSKAYFTKHGFAKANLTPPIGCGPYQVADMSPGSTVKYARVKDWWGADIPSQKGQYNFDISYKNYRDTTVLVEAFKSQDYDFRSENIAKSWANNYSFPAVKKGKVIVEEVDHNLPQGMQMFAMNLRRKPFDDIRVREAMNYAFDYEWLNENLFYNSYKRNSSYFENSDLKQQGAPQGEELTYLEKYRGRIPEEVFTAEFKNPTTNGSGNNRKNLAKADELLRQAGWIVKNGKRVNDKTGKPLRIEFLSPDPSYERIILAYKRSLARLGIEVQLRTVNPAQYIERVESFDFDMIMHTVLQSETPGNEQRDFWGSSKANVKGSRNISGINNPVIDQIVEDIIDAQTREQLITRTSALDRILLWNHYSVPGWFLGTSRVAYWDKFQRPKTKPKDGIGFTTWWVDPQKEKALHN